MFVESLHLKTCRPIHQSTTNLALPHSRRISKNKPWETKTAKGDQVGGANSHSGRDERSWLVIVGQVGRPCLKNKFRLMFFSWAKLPTSTNPLFALLRRPRQWGGYF